MLSPTTLRIVIAALSALVLAGLAVAVLAANAVERTERSSRTVRGAVDRLVVDSDAGDLRLRPTSEAGVTVHETRRFSNREPKVSVELRDGTLHIAVSCSGAFTFSCSDDLDLGIPRTVRTAELELDSGDVDVAGFDGDRFAIETDSGDVTARLRAGSVTAKTDAGDVVLALDSAPQAVEAETDSGDVDLSLPRGSYRIATETDSGDVALDGVLDADAASRRVAARTDSGDVGVHGR